MRRRFALLLCTVVVLAACSSSSMQSTPPTQPAPVDFRGQKSVDVNANGNLFTPASMIVTSGTTVTWHNTDTEAHNVQKADDSANFGVPFGVKTPEFAPGATYSFTFATPGTYFYTCTIHTGMNGKVQVVGLGQSVTSSTAVG